MKSIHALFLLGFTLWGLGCQSTALPPTQSLDTQQEIILGYAFRSMAWDGSRLWQVAQEETQQLLVSQNLFTGQARAIPLTPPLPVHNSLTHHQDHFWLLDQKNTLHQLNPSGKTLNSLSLDLPAFSGAEQITWLNDELWLLHKAFISEDSTQENARFYQIDPDTGEILNTLIVPDNSFSDLPHLNLTAHDDAFYVITGHVFADSKNLVYRIDREKGAVTVAKLDRILTGVSTSFFHQDTLYGVELLDLDRNCGASCKGQLQVFPLPE